MRTFKSLAILASVAVVLTLGCSTHGHPIYSVNSAPIVTKDSKPLSLEVISDGIVRAGASVGWKIAPEEPGRLVGRYMSGVNNRHVAVVSIEHDTKTYSIKYRDSTNLNAEPGENKIHKAYNEWVQALDKAITGQLSVY